jgi:TonB family protein
LREIGVHGVGFRRNEFRRFLFVSTLLHAALVFSFALRPGFETSAPAGVIAVELVGLPSSAPKPRPAPAAAPAPRPKPPVPAKRVLPKEPAPLPEPKPKPQVKPRPRPAETPPEPRARDREIDDIMAELRSQAGEDRPAPPEPREIAAARPAPAGAGGRGRPVSPEVAEWMRRARVHIRRSWVVPPGFRTQSLETVVKIELDASGNVRGKPRVVKRSGNPWYDDGVIRSIQKASPLPAPPDSGVWTFVLLSDEAY